ncbi:hypothetical protein L1049_021418 [Liquidambar formosana]|uniref:Uncharacterized protein n=1 Tax=Liquidambar formosana TaxID=63359 RepID=A0AAP0N7K1_LIQFO
MDSQLFNATPHRKLSFENFCGWLGLPRVQSNLNPIIRALKFPSSVDSTRYSPNPEKANTITQGRFIRDGETVVSAGQNFVLGFFSPVNSTLRYVGIWFNKIPPQTILWVANREKPISRTAGILTFGNDGNLAVLDGNGNSVWSTNVSVIVSNDTTAILMDTGNLLLSSTENIGKPFKAYWQSFNNPTDTYLPGMRVPVNTSTGERRVFTSWKTASDPSPGSYSMGIDPRGSSQIVIWEQSNRRWRSGHWNGQVFTGVPSMRGLYFYGFKLSPVNGDGNMYFTYTPTNSSDMLRFQIGWDGIEEQLQWDDGIKDWRVLQLQPDEECGICIEGFEPRYMDQWNRGNWSDSVVATDMEECKDKCLKNCSCNACTFHSGIGCMIWSGDLVDVEQLSEGGTTLQVRLADSELAMSNSWRKDNDIPLFGAGTSIEFSTDFLGPDDLVGEGQEGSGPGLRSFDFSCVVVATKNFFEDNKLGQGGFGPVYKVNSYFRQIVKFWNYRINTL